MISIVDAGRLRGAVSWEAAVGAVRDALVSVGSGRVVQPPAIELRMPDHGELHVKCGHLTGSRWIVVKIAGGGFGAAAPSGCLLVLDAITGQPRWLLDDQGWLTEQRTAAAGTLASLTFGRHDSRDVLFLGTGGLTRALVEAHQAVAPELRLTVWGRNRQRADLLADALGIAVATDLQAAVTTTDILVTATSSRSPLIDADWIQPGTHITALGADTIGKQELPVALLDRAVLLVCDDLATARQAGELQHAPDTTKDRAVAWPDLAAAHRLARATEAITIADLCGIGAEDAAISALFIETQTIETPDRVPPERGFQDHHR